MAVIELLHRHKPNITYLLVKMKTKYAIHAAWMLDSVRGPIIE